MEQTISIPGKTIPAQTIKIPPHCPKPKRNKKPFEFWICWDQAKKQHLDLIEAESLDMAEAILDHIKEHGKVFHSQKQEDFEEGYYISLDGWQHIPIPRKEIYPHYNKYTAGSRLTKTYPTKEIAHAHLDAIKLRGKLHSLSIEAHLAIEAIKKSGQQKKTPPKEKTKKKRKRPSQKKAPAKKT